ncbi:hypothetical protein [uncultured Maribacter sp.]|uniref:hypothetical protein n=1 Tax=uncultured Maribacter sp. TaxID=431308 RepID=UPI0026109ACF|nr:hypothetical protein [uncultured Maribacter sp.]
MIKKLHLILVLVIFQFSCKPDKDLFEKLNTDNSVKLIFPEQNSECNTGNIISNTESEITFKWSDSYTNQTYEIHLTNLFLNTTQIIESKNFQAQIQLNRGVAYSWSIVSITPNNFKTETEKWFFYNAGPSIKNYIPFPASAISPVSEANVVFSPTISLNWESSDIDNNIESYDVYFGTENPPKLHLESVKENILNSVPIETKTSYYWQIKTKDSTGNESFSEIFNFNVE